MIPARFLPQKKHVLMAAVSLLVLLVLYSGTFFIFFRLDERIIVSHVTAYREEDRGFETVFFCAHESRIVEYDVREWVHIRLHDEGFTWWFMPLYPAYKPLHAVIALLDRRQRDVMEHEVQVEERYMQGWEKGQRIPLEHFDGIVAELLTRDINGGTYVIR